jgi:hypothetical protein
MQARVRNFVELEKNTSWKRQVQGILVFIIAFVFLKITIPICGIVLFEHSAAFNPFVTYSISILFALFSYYQTIKHYQKIKEKFKEHWIIYTILLSPIIGVFLFVVYIMIVFGIIQYYSGQPNNNESEGLQSPFLSTRGLPPPATDVPVILPPDPGEAGKTTLAGIDSNNDGVRDDLEREIIYMYPQNQEVRKVLRAMVKKEQDMITTTGDHEHFKGLTISSLAFLDCYNYLVFGVDLADHSKSNFLISLVRNTSERLRIAQKNSKIALPYSSAVHLSSEACLQPLVKGQY